MHCADGNYEFHGSNSATELARTRAPNHSDRAFSVYDNIGHSHQQEPTVELPEPVRVRLQYLYTLQPKLREEVPVLGAGQFNKPSPTPRI